MGKLKGHFTQGFVLEARLDDVLRDRMFVAESFDNAKATASFFMNAVGVNNVRVYSGFTHGGKIFTRRKDLRLHLKRRKAAPTRGRSRFGA